MEILQQFGPLIFIIIIFYFLMIRPQQKRAKLEKEFENTLKVGDRVITKSGIHGRIAELSTDTVIIETMAGKLKFERTAISLELSKKLHEKK